MTCFASQILKFAPCGGGRHHTWRPPRLGGPGRLPALPGAVLDIGAAIGAVHVSKRAIRPPRIERQDTLLGLILAGVPRCNVFEIDRQYVGNRI
jgi:hypothetical protein